MLVEGEGHPEFRRRLQLARDALAWEFWRREAHLYKGYSMQQSCGRLELAILIERQRLALGDRFELCLARLRKLESDTTAQQRNGEVNSASLDRLALEFGRCMRLLGSPSRRYQGRV